MPPKRKREDDATATTAPSRATRSSARSTAKEEVSETPEAPAKKAKTTAAKSKAKSTTAKSKKAPVKKDDDSAIHAVQTSQAYDHAPPAFSDEPATPVAATKASRAAKGKTASTTAATANRGKGKSTATPQVYSDAAASHLFLTYADEDNKDAIGPSGFERLCEEAELSLDGTQPLIISWMFEPRGETPEMMSIQKEAWSTGCRSLQISSLPVLRQAVADLEELLVMNIPPPKSTAKTQPYDKTTYRSYTQDPKAAFRKLYSFCFTLAKPEASKNIEMETAVAMWTVLLTTRYPLMTDIVDFINENGSYKAANKDLWSMMFEFVDTVKTDLTGYEADGAWPSLIDAFVEWKRARPPREEDVEVE